jgi:hypothetical protein
MFVCGADKGKDKRLDPSFPLEMVGEETDRGHMKYEEKH